VGERGALIDCIGGEHRRSLRGGSETEREHRGDEKNKTAPSGDLCPKRVRRVREKESTKRKKLRVTYSGYRAPTGEEGASEEGKKGIGHVRKK